MRESKRQIAPQGRGEVLGESSADEKQSKKAPPLAGGVGGGLLLIKK
ncbi:hypothetical protein [Helicobacter sp. T3_23-1059]